MHILLAEAVPSAQVVRPTRIVEPASSGNSTRLRSSRRSTSSLSTFRIRLEYSRGTAPPNLMLKSRFRRSFLIKSAEVDVQVDFRLLEARHGLFAAQFPEGCGLGGGCSDHGGGRRRRGCRGAAALAPGDSGA